MLQNVLKHWSPRVEVLGGLRQSGAIPYAIIDGRIAFLLVSSRKSGRWIFPKGGVPAGLTPWDSAAKEALEEAGVAGRIETTPLGSYRTSSSAPGSPVIDVDLFPLLVEQQFEHWQEENLRLRHWVTLSDARRLLADRSLARLAAQLHARHVASHATKRSSAK
ncbi:NUDIX hydrolase [Devosia sp. PTR5]|uniref:NUDIX hydrolase n=1 Tax=Devosia oryzisoli TaxID=2774138 RepID=A0A927IRW6_9HYPH|nr:NUDIX hydrolase [Devosia oryzisoli]MBD8064217.1 NUDIX hydrolase [Devosia oryzisoli]